VINLKVYEYEAKLRNSLSRHQHSIQSIDLNHINAAWQEGVSLTYFIIKWWLVKYCHYFKQSICSLTKTHAIKYVLLPSTIARANDTLAVQMNTLW